MSEPQPLGDVIRERRLVLGFSAGQLAMRLRSTAAVVRTWERGHEPVPDEAFAGLADLLGLAEADLRALQPVMEDESEELPDESAPEPVAAVVPAAEVEASEEVSAVQADDVDESDEDEEPEDEEEPPEVVAEETDEGTASADASAEESSDEPSPASNGNGASGVVGHAMGMDIDTGLLEAPTEAIEPVRPARAATATRLRRRVRPPRIAPEPQHDPSVTPEVEPTATEVDGSVPAWLGPIMVLFDPSKRYLYWARWIGTAIGLYILFRILGFSLGELVDAVGDFWDSFRTPEGPEAESAVTSLGPLG